MFFSKIKENLKKTKEAIDIKLSNVFVNSKDIDEIIDGIEETLILSDVGMQSSVKICDGLRTRLKAKLDKSKAGIISSLKEEMIDILTSENKLDEKDMSSKQVVLVVGVNGVGKTTSIGKLTNLYKNQGKRVLLVAADTFRAGAVEQLKIWGDRNSADVYLGKNEGEDPASVIYDGTKMFLEGNYDILICDTAGRLHNKKNLMDELSKMRKIIDRNLPDIPTNVMMVLDATTGQNGAIQAKNFSDKVNVDYIFLTKLDSTAKGGIIFTIVDELKIPVKYVGVGESIDDIEEFVASDFVNALLDGTNN